LFTLKDVNFQNFLHYPSLLIPQGVATFICGESGTGKSTLLKLLNGVLSPTGGEIFYLGKRVGDYDPILLRRDVLLVSQQVYLFDKTVKENFDEYYMYRGLEALSDEAITEYLRICAANIPLESACYVLSGGERQRVFSAVNLSFCPKVLMMDEPTSALDDKTANIFMENIKTHCAANNITLIVVSHDKNITEKFADNIIFLKGGQNELR
jgi:putative ABC transport system ATP-binding protein